MKDQHNLGPTFEPVYAGVGDPALFWELFRKSPPG
jgi:hypothetical protein